MLIIKHIASRDYDKKYKTSTSTYEKLKWRALHWKEVRNYEWWNIKWSSGWCRSAKLVFNFRLIHWKSSCTSHAISFKLNWREGERVIQQTSESERWKMKKHIKNNDDTMLLLYCCCSSLNLSAASLPEKNVEKETKYEEKNVCTMIANISASFLPLMHFFRAVCLSCSNFNTTTSSSMLYFDYKIFSIRLSLLRI